VGLGASEWDKANGRARQEGRQRKEDREPARPEMRRAWCGVAGRIIRSALQLPYVVGRVGASARWPFFEGFATPRLGRVRRMPGGSHRVLRIGYGALPTCRNGGHRTGAERISELNVQFALWSSATRFT
jgi:hypothetical protein